jgi:hypothetical protein
LPTHKNADVSLPVWSPWIDMIVVINPSISCMFFTNLLEASQRSNDSLEACKFQQKSWSEL